MRIRPVGGDDEIPVDVRVIAATNHQIEERVEQGHFRPDLYFRLNVVRAVIPPLRERKEDLEVLIDNLLQRMAERHGREVIGISAEAEAWMRSHPWPGNVRELANTLERAVALTDHDTIVIEDLILPESGSARQSILERAISEELSLGELERLYMRRVLESVDGNKSRAARWLGIDRRTLSRKLELEEEEPEEAEER